MAHSPPDGITLTLPDKGSNHGKVKSGKNNFFAKVLDLPAAETLSQSSNGAFLEIPMQLRIENMTCGGCVRGVTKAILSVDPAALVAADPDLRLAVVTTQSAESDVLFALENFGFPASTVS